MSVRMRHTRAHTANRRSHHALKEQVASLCPKCEAPYTRHTVCMNCGTYRGKEVIDVAARAERTAARAKRKEAALKASGASNPEEKKESGE